MRLLSLAVVSLFLGLMTAASAFAVDPTLPDYGIGTQLSASEIATGRVMPTTTIRSGTNGYVTSTLTLGPGVLLDPTASTDTPTGSVVAQAPSGFHWAIDRLTAYNYIGQRAWAWEHQLKWSFANWNVQNVQVNRGIPIANDWGWQFGGNIFVYTEPQHYPASHIWAYARARENYCIPYCWKSQYPEIDFRVNGAGNLTADNKWVDGD